MQARQQMQGEQMVQKMAEKAAPQLADKMMDGMENMDAGDLAAMQGQVPQQ